MQEMNGLHYQFVMRGGILFKPNYQNAGNECSSFIINLSSKGHFVQTQEKSPEYFMASLKILHMFYMFTREG